MKKPKRPSLETFTDPVTGQVNLSAYQSAWEDYEERYDEWNKYKSNPKIPPIDNDDTYQDPYFY